MARYRIILSRNDKEVEVWYVDSAKKLGLQIQVICSRMDYDPKYSITITPSGR